MNVLIDTSVWVDHFRKSNGALVALITTDQALMHPMVLAELACGTPPAPRARTLSDLALLRQANQASLDEIMAFIEQERLYGLGCGLVDMAILVSTMITPGALLWARDKRLVAMSERFGVAYRG